MVWLPLPNGLFIIVLPTLTLLFLIHVVAFEPIRFADMPKLSSGHMVTSSQHLCMVRPDGRKLSS
jgi:hypothetical protein